MEIIFFILKIIGILLLAVLGIFLFLILSIVFIPVRYRIRAKGAYPGSMEQDTVLYWFFHVIHCRIQYGEEGLKFRFRIFGIPLGFGQKKRRTKHVSSGRDTQEEAAGQEDFVRTAQAEAEETDSLEEQGGFETPDKPGEEQDFETQDKTLRRHRRRKGVWKQKWRRIKEQIHNIKNILLEETNKNAARMFWGECKYLMGHFMPHKAAGELQFGMTDPAKTGQILGIISLLPFWYHYEVSVMPDFAADSFYVQGEIFLKGHIRPLHLLKSGIRLMKDKNIRRLIHQIMA